MRNKFRSHFLIEVALVAALAIYLAVAEGQAVGDNLAFTVAGAGLMSLVTYWTLSTLRGGLEVIAVRVSRPGH
ncbi:hypothetical protein [Marinobacter salinus]|uniref:hypothetical protein n=1 Tax=Marinobacter salinus TaxID=1874317 RepID=UPI001D0D7366|nr:hypothetical protein [Marinobacter salinus]